jgi:hypothetical protein
MLKSKNKKFSRPIFVLPLSEKDTIQQDARMLYDSVISFRYRCSILPVSSCAGNTIRSSMYNPRRRWKATFV